MRVPTLQTSRDAFGTIAGRQAELGQLQSRISSGLRVQSPGDDPTAAAQAELARSRLAAVARDQRSADLAASVLNAADGALAQGVDLLQSVREGLVAAGNGAYSPADRASLAQKLAAARDQLLQLANSPDGSGGFIFGGQGTPVAPVSGDATPQYAAAAGEQRIGESGRYATTVDGRTAFMELPQGNGVFLTASLPANTGAAWIGAGAVTAPAQLTGHNYTITMGGAAGALTYSIADTTSGAALATGVPWTSGTPITVDGQQVRIQGTPAPGDGFTLAPAGTQSVFRTLQDAVSVLQDPTMTGVRYNEALERVQAGLDRALEGLVLARSQVGARLQDVDAGTAQNGNAELAATQRRSSLRDMDLAAGISELQSGQVGLEAAIKSYAAAGRKSLFDFIG